MPQLHLKESRIKRSGWARSNITLLSLFLRLRNSHAGELLWLHTPEGHAFSFVVVFSLFFLRCS